MTRITLRVGASSRHRTATLYGHEIDAVQGNDGMWRVVARQAPHRVLCEDYRLSTVEYALSRWTPAQLEAVIQGRPVTTST